MAATTTFENAFVQGFAELSRAMAFHNRNNSKKSLSYDTLKPENFKSSFFHGRLPEDMKSYIKIIYDASLYGNNIVSGFLVNVNHRLHNCQIVQKSAYDIEHVYICDFKKTKTMMNFPTSLTSEYCSRVEAPTREATSPSRCKRLIPSGGKGRRGRGGGGGGEVKLPLTY